MEIKTFVLCGFVCMLAGCATRQAVWTKAGASTQEASSTYSKCEYQVRLQKTPQVEMQRLMSLCMQGEGYRLVRR